MLYQCIRQKISSDAKIAIAPLQRAEESNLPTGTFPPNIIPCTPYAKSSEGARIDSNKWPPAVESEDGTVQDETITRMSPMAATNFPTDFAFPLIENQMPTGTKHKGIQNQIAASSIESICWTATL